VTRSFLEGFFNKLKKDSKDYTSLLKTQFEFKCLEFITNLLFESNLSEEKTLQEIPELKEFLPTKPTS
jgi:hypothetical protein